MNVPPTAEGLRAARDALAAGGKVRLDGASGLIEFDETGDRIAQLYTVWQPRT